MSIATTLDLRSALASRRGANAAMANRPSVPQDAEIEENELSDRMSTVELTLATANADAFSVQPTVAYLSMEIALDPAMPTYSGGLGVLAGDTLRACADLTVPVIAVTLLHRRGYLSQTPTYAKTDITLCQLEQ